MLEGEILQTVYKDGEKLVTIHSSNGCAIEIQQDNVQVQVEPKVTSYVMTLSEHPEEYNPQHIPTQEEEEIVAEKEGVLAASRLALKYVKIGV